MLLKTNDNTKWQEKIVKKRLARETAGETLKTILIDGDLILRR